jgi:hypothetical protein
MKDGLDCRSNSGSMSLCPILPVKVLWTVDGDVASLAGRSESALEHSHEGCTV